MEEGQELSNRILLGGVVGFLSLAAFLIAGSFLAGSGLPELPVRLALSGPFLLAGAAVVIADRWYVKRRRKQIPGPGAK
jgi:hypothetical protein